MKQKSILSIALLLIVSAAFASPAGVKENSPPAVNEMLMPAPEAIQIVELTPMFTLDEVVINQENPVAEVSAVYASTPEYASHISDVAFAPLYRWEANITTSQTSVENHLKYSAGKLLQLYRKPEAIPRK